MNDILIGMDAGTSMTKCAAFSTSGDLLASRSRTNRYDTSPEGAAVQNLPDTRDALIGTLSELTNATGSLPARIRSLRSARWASNNEAGSYPAWPWNGCCIHRVARQGGPIGLVARTCVPHPSVRLNSMPLSRAHARSIIITRARARGREPRRRGRLQGAVKGGNPTTMTEQSERELTQAIRELGAATERNTAATDRLTSRMEQVDVRLASKLDAGEITEFVESTNRRFERIEQHLELV